jgi:hypothetical protein
MIIAAKSTAKTGIQRALVLDMIDPVVDAIIQKSSLDDADEMMFIESAL